MGIVDPDIVNLSNIHRQSLYSIEDLKKSKVKSAQKKLKKINSKIKVNAYKIRLNINNYQKIIKIVLLQGKIFFPCKIQEI